MKYFLYNVYCRISNLTEIQIEDNLEHPYDCALAAYLWVLKDNNACLTMACIFIEKCKNLFSSILNRIFFKIMMVTDCNYNYNDASSSCAESCRSGSDIQRLERISA